MMKHGVTLIIMDEHEPATVIAETVTRRTGPRPTVVMAT